MFSSETDKVKKISESFFKKAGFSVLISASKKDNVILLEIKTDEPKVLIGQGGQTLSEIQHILRLMSKKVLENSLFLDIDINQYKEKKNAYLKDMARSYADEVFLSKEEKILPPMTPYERRVIHMELKDRSDVVTESIGEGKREDWL